MNNPSMTADALIVKAAKDEIQGLIAKMHGITIFQLIALEKLISKSKDASDFTKRLLIWLLRKSEYLTRNIFVVVKDAALSAEVSRGVHDMRSCMRGTHLSEIMHATGSRWSFSFHMGIDSTCVGTGCRVWLSQHDYDGRARPVELDLEAVAAIKFHPVHD